MKHHRIITAAIAGTAALALAVAIPVTASASASSGVTMTCRSVVTFNHDLAAAAKSAAGGNGTQARKDLATLAYDSVFYNAGKQPYTLQRDYLDLALDLFVVQGDSWAAVNQDFGFYGGTCKALGAPIVLVKV